MNPNTALGISNLSMAALFIVLAIPLIQRNVKMNRVYGIRIKKAFASDDNWYKINEYGGRKLLTWSIVLAVFGIVTFFLPLGTEEQPNDAMVLVVALAPLIILTPWIIQILSFAKKV